MDTQKFAEADDKKTGETLGLGEQVETPATRVPSSEFQAFLYPPTISERIGQFLKKLIKST